MKNSLKLLKLLLLLLVVSVGCNKTEDGEYVKPITIVEKIAGTWQISSIKQIDELAKAASLDLTEKRLTTLFNFSTFKITFNVDTDKNPTSYEVSGGAPELFDNAGYWQLDKDFIHTNGEPSYIYLYSDAAKTQMTDKLKIAAMPGQRDIFDFQLIRSKNGNPFLTYHYSLKLVN